MRVFVTGASGWIGSAVVPELIAAGHQVVGLARSDASAAALTKAGAEVRHGSLDDLEVLREAAAESDGVIHLAFRHDLAFSGSFDAATEADRRAIDTLGEALAGSGRPLVIASGILGLAPGRVATEEDGQPSGREGGAGAEAPASGPAGRLANAHATLALADRNVRPSVVRLPPTVHGDGDHGFLATVVATARAKDVSGYIGDGANRWPAVHRDDAARLFRLALENAPAGATLHAIGDEGVPIRTVAEVIGKHLGVPVASVAPADAAAHFTWLADLLALDSPASADRTRALLDWRPTGPGLLDDLAEGHYFKKSPAA
ncbi:SDR family oxidoreductase [Streptomyces sp. NBC_01335]|uniref:SDR family oxidoreductase n=1 Tax=Streptomyces sp. NBC_01335 TaxID=2903828 RepID=UPI002E115EB9|nr:SDR family oxidoreductase [Streptomyces sp. NBC_01335]